MKLPGRSATRTDEIRRRRDARSRAAQQSAKARKSRVVTPPPPPVMARTPMAGISRPVAQGSRRGRRLYNVSLDPAQGMEMSLPALPRLALSWRLISLFLVAMLGYALYYSWESPTFRVDAPQIEGLQRLTINEVNATIGLIGEPIFLLDAPSIEADLREAFPEFSSAQVQIKLPNSVTIVVTERTPVLIWSKGGESSLVDDQGVTFPVRSSTPSGSYPVIEASGDPPKIVLPSEQSLTPRGETLNKITGILLPQLAPRDQVHPLISPGMVKAVLLLAKQAPTGAKLIYDPTHGLGWTDRRGWNVYLGDEQDIETKMLVYRAIIENIKGGEVRPTMISVEYLHAPYYRIEN